VTQLGVGWVVISTAGGGASLLRLGPFAAHDAESLADLILAQQRVARQMRLP
jgi:hypothetical protein